MLNRLKHRRDVRFRVMANYSGDAAHEFRVSGVGFRVSGLKFSGLRSQVPVSSLKVPLVTVRERSDRIQMSCPSRSELTGPHMSAVATAPVPYRVVIQLRYGRYRSRMY